MEPTEAKKDLRKRMLATLRATPGAQCALFSAKLRERLERHLPPAGGNVAVYAPLPHEVDLLPLVAAHRELRFIFPRCLPGRVLEFRHVADTAAQLIPGAHGIPAPAPDRPVVEPEDIDLLVVPGVAFTAGGKRLGYGGGYYDRFIPRCTRARIIAAAFPWQIIPDLPTEPHDLTLPLIIR